MSTNLYAEEIISNYEHPHNKGKMEDADASFEEHNPVCGDDIKVYLKISEAKVDDAKFDGEGCSISTAGASMLTDYVKGKSIEELSGMGVKDMIDLLGIEPGPARLHCATISLKALKEAIFLYEHKEPDENTKDL
ncbi:FeS cluster assembly scaffold protein NifU [Candidatus Mancarchaeum acidiphilum]|uniref:FeS cluster assembly scaffold protein NifU n=1 Tax=Candidatus Mancarchaeum acidiphilum TaxID=1920749 RepID=A0A218NMW7_9ARCH|nr:SUF system NifU family Fe-S cluster assembly protein [Candidatus Mancarchaeum acidiphilum]ASI13803.1 FeS cluster assembly scaffold protein NifU [Candidatus Mancarchaeum acidiphilum]